jgi:hypothetical protein
MSWPHRAISSESASGGVAAGAARTAAIVARHVLGVLVALDMELAPCLRLGLAECSNTRQTAITYIGHKVFVNMTDSGYIDVCPSRKS